MGNTLKGKCGCTVRVPLPNGTIGTIDFEIQSGQLDKAAAHLTSLYARLPELDSAAAKQVKARMKALGHKLDPPVPIATPAGASDPAPKSPEPGPAQAEL